jgi:hypothetical protein
MKKQEKGIKHEIGKEEKIICQKKGCKNEANWIVISPSLLEKGKPNPIDLLQKPIGFCNTDHLVEFFRDEFFDWAGKEENRKYKRGEQK